MEEPIEERKCKSEERQQAGRIWKKLTLMSDLKNRPQDLMPLLALVRRVLGVFHLVTKFQQGVFEVLEPVGRGFAGARGADWRHFGREFLLVAR